MKLGISNKIRHRFKTESVQVSIHLISINKLVTFLCDIFTVHYYRAASMFDYDMKRKYVY